MARKYVMLSKLTRGANPARQLETIEQEFENVYRILRQLGVDIDAIDVTEGGAAGGDVFGPSSSVDGEIVLFDGATGKLLRRASGTGPVKVTAGVYSVGLIDLGTEVTGLLDASMIVGLEHDLLSTTHEDTEPDPPVAGALIYGAYTDTAISWFDGLPCEYIPTDDNLGSMKFWFDGLPYGAIGASVRWKRLPPPTVVGSQLTYTGSTLAWL